MKGFQLGTSTTATFRTDLSEAHKEEAELGKWCSSQYNCKYQTTQMNGSDPRWDLELMFNDGNITIEVKMDKMVWKTKNVAVEYQRTLNDGTVKPTCINKTEADWWVYIFDNRYHFIETDKLKSLIDSNDFPVRHGAGEGDRASVYLIPVETFKEFCVIYPKQKQ